jgi:hypothetical protein
MMAAIVVPFGCRNIAMMRSCFEPSRFCAGRGAACPFLLVFAGVDFFRVPSFFAFAAGGFVSFGSAATDSARGRQTCENSSRIALRQF